MPATGEDRGAEAAGAQDPTELARFDPRVHLDLWVLCREPDYAGSGAFSSRGQAFGPA
jgi:hypothetical protein